MNRPHAQHERAQTSLGFHVRVDAASGNRRGPAAVIRRWGALAGLAALVFGGAGCTSLHPPAGPGPERTRLNEAMTVFSGRLIGNHLVVETQVDRVGTARFLIDTGSSVTLVSPDFAARLGASPARTAPQVRVRTASGSSTVLSSLTLRRLGLTGVRFERVPALLFDMGELSSHLGVQLDGILGFPLFADIVLTLDYPQQRVILSPANSPALVPGSTLTFNQANGVPLIPIQLGDRTLHVLVDSGSDGSFNLNPLGLDLSYASGPRPGATVSTLSGERKQEMARLGSDTRIGGYQLLRPIVDLTDQLSSFGGGMLRNFVLTFDQRRGTVTFYRESTAPIETLPVRNVGLGFSRTPAYWRVVSVIPDSPAERAGILPGDLVTRINGQPVEAWDLTRYDTLMRTAPWVEFTFLNGREETTGRIAVVELVP